MAEEKTAREKNEAAKQQAEVKPAVVDFTDLTKKNQDYMFHLEKELDQRKYAQKNEALSKVHAELLEKQKTGIVATKLYGPVTKKADEIIAGPKKPAKIPTLWEMALDNGLMMFALFCAMYAIFGVFSKNSNQTNAGIITLIATSVVAGIGLGYFYRQMLGQQKQRNWGRVILNVIILVAAWMAVFGLVGIIPPSVNVVLPPVAYATLAIIAFAVRIYVKKRLDIPNPADLARQTNDNNKK